MTSVSYVTLLPNCDLDTIAYDRVKTSYVMLRTLVAQSQRERVY